MVKIAREVKRAERAYGLNHAAWRKLRAVILMEEPLCRACLAATPQRLTPSKQVDHINEDPNDNDRGNLQALCTPCHSRKTLAAGKGWAKRWSGRRAGVLDAVLPANVGLARDGEVSPTRPSATRSTDLCAHDARGGRVESVGGEQHDSPA